MEQAEQIAAQRPRRPSHRRRWQHPPLALQGFWLSVGLLVWVVLLGMFGSIRVMEWSAQALPQIVLLAMIAGTLYLIPGLALLRLCWPHSDLSIAEELALATSIGIALPPLVFQAAHLIGLSWNREATLSYIAVSLFVLTLVWSVQHRRGVWQPQPVGIWHAFLLCGAVGVALLTRLYVIRDLPVGMWGDSYQHTMIAQLLVDNNGLFSSWEPYAPLVTFTYHYGFHANVALFHWLSDRAVPQSVLYVGQFVNLAALASAYVLTTRLSGSRHAGLWAVVLVGFVNTLPAYYVNWGRYTQLTGQVILAAVVVCWMACLEARPVRWRLCILTALLTASLMLTHYIVAIFAAVVLAIYVLLLLVRRPGVYVWRSVLARSLAAGGLGVVLAAPWLLNTLSGYLGRNVGGFVQQTVDSERIVRAANLPPINPFYLGTFILVLAGIGMLVALGRHDWRVAMLALWSAALIFMVVPHLLGLPGTGVINWFTAYLGLYVTAVPLAGYTLGMAQSFVAKRYRGLGYLCASVGVVAASTWGLHWQEDLLQSKHQLFRPADAAAMEWIREHTPPDALFLVNMFPAYGNTLFVGSDGGWWIPLLTQRRTTLPPLTYGSERAASPDFSRHVNKFAFALREHPLPSEEGIQLCQEAGIQYIYSGAHAGQPHRIDVEALRRHPDFQIVYEQDGVVIFELLPEAQR